MSDLLPLRGYQEECLDVMDKCWSEGKTRVAAVLPTGAGKTVVFAHLIKRFRTERPDSRVLVLAHTDELVTQAAKKIRDVAPHLRTGIVKASRNEITSDVIVASVQTLRNTKRRERIKGVGLIIVDECHHSTASTYRTIMEHFGAFDEEPTIRLAGFTATFARGDNAKLSEIWEEVAYRKDIVFMIREGYLLNIRGKRIEVPDLDLSKVKKTRGDFSEGDLGEAIEHSMAPEVVAKSYVEHSSGRSGVVFTPTVATAYLMADNFNSLGIRTEVVHGGLATSDRRDIIARLASGETQVVSNCAVLTEGFDEPRVSTVVIARPTRSAPLYCLDAQTEILTDRGWSSVDTLDPTSRAAAWDQGSGKVSWSPILGMIDRPLRDGETFYALQSPTLDVRVTDGHRMLWRMRKGGYRISTAKELSGRQNSYLLPISGTQDAPGVPLTDDELRFLGWFMTDGSLSRANGSIRICQAEHQPWNADIETMLKGCGFKYTVHRVTRETQFNRTSAGIVYQISKGAPRGTGTHLRGWGELEPYISKDFPTTLEDVTRDQLHVLLEAIHLGDGAKQLGQDWTRRSYHISTSNETFADRLQSLCVRRGFKCNKSPISYNENPAWTLHIKDAQERYVGGANATDRPTLKPDASTPGERVWCIETDKGTIITRRNGKVAILGNCQMVGRGLRLYPGQTEALLLDVVGASKAHDLRSLVDLSSARPDTDCPDCTLLDLEEMAERGESFKPIHFGDVDTVEFDPLVRASRRVWLMTRGGTYFLSAGDHAYVFLCPSTKPIGTWDVAWCSKGKTALDGGFTDHQGVEMEYALAWGEEVAAERGGEVMDTYTAKGKSWRSKPASSAQLDLARRLRLGVPETIRSGELSKLIDTHLASQRIDPVVAAIIKQRSGK